MTHRTEQNHMIRNTHDNSTTPAPPSKTRRGWGGHHCGGRENTCPTGEEEDKGGRGRGGLKQTHN